MFIPDNTFKSKIFRELETGDKSISSLHRSLVEDGHKVHRLVLTGYLKAMEEMGLLTSREFPPSKVYSIIGIAEKDIYETVGDICANTSDFSNTPKHELVLYFLQKLFKRPVFRSELARAGVDADPESFALKVSNEERLEIKRSLSKRGLKLSLKDQAYMLVDVNMDREFDMILQQVVLQEFKSGNLALDTKQLTLGV